MSRQIWLLERAMALLAALMRDQGDVGLVRLPPGGASLEEIERAALIAALHQTDWVQKDAADLLKISPRVMGYKVTKHGLIRPPWRRSGPLKRGRDDGHLLA